MLHGFVELSNDIVPLQDNQFSLGLVGSLDLWEHVRPDEIIHLE